VLSVHDKLALQRIDDVALDLLLFCFLKQTAHAVKIFVSGKNCDPHNSYSLTKSYNMNKSVEIKELKKFNRTASVLMVATAIVACSSAHQAQRNTEVHQQGSWLGEIAPTGKGTSLEMRKLWARHLDGYITELSLAGHGNALLVSTLPDYDHEGGAKKNLLRYFDSNGHELWHEVMPTQVKSQALSNDGSLAVATTHENQVIAYDKKGKKLWTAQSTCMPFIIESRKEIVCYHDDDAEPLVAFDVFGWDGKLKQSFPIKNDILALKVSKDEQHVALALTKGIVLLLGPDYKTEWSGKVPGEAVDLDVSNGPHPKVAVIYSEGAGKSSKIALLSGGKLVSESPSAGQVSQIAFSSDAGLVFTYGNGETGQYVGGLSVSPLREVWHHEVENNAHYTPQMYTATIQPKGASLAVVGIEQVSAANGRQSEVVGVGHQGQPLWTLPVSQALGAEEGAFLYTQSLTTGATGPAKLAVATDDRKLGLFQLSEYNR
jgi:hypothetical protein